MPIDPTQIAEPSEPLQPFDIADPAVLINEIAGKFRLTEGTVLLALLENPSTEQRLVQVERLPDAHRQTDEEGLRALLREAMDALPLPAEYHPITHAVVAVVVRAGFTVLGRREMDWTYAWRYSNHLRPAFTGDLILVTEHGWLDWVTGWADHEPRMVAR